MRRGGDFEVVVIHSPLVFCYVDWTGNDHIFVPIHECVGMLFRRWKDSNCQMKQMPLLSMIRTVSRSLKAPTMWFLPHLHQNTFLQLPTTRFCFGAWLLDKNILLTTLATWERERERCLLVGEGGTNCCLDYNTIQWPFDSFLKRVILEESAVIVLFFNSLSALVALFHTTHNTPYVSLFLKILTQKLWMPQYLPITNHIECHMVLL